MTNFKRILSALMAVMMVLGMFSCLSLIGLAGSNEEYVHAADNWDKTYNTVNDYTTQQNNNIKTYAQLDAAYTDKPYVYYGIAVYEEADSSTPGAFAAQGKYWVDTDHKVQPGDELLVRYYYKSNAYIASFDYITMFSRKFFDIEPNAQLSYNSTYDYGDDSQTLNPVGYFKDGLYNTGHTSLATTPINTNGPAYTCPEAGVTADITFTWARASAYDTSFRTKTTIQKFGFTLPLVYSWDITRITCMYNHPTSWDTSRQVGYQMRCDDYLAEDIIKVRTTAEPYTDENGVTSTINYVEDGTVGYIGIDNNYTKEKNNAAKTLTYFYANATDYGSANQIKAFSNVVYNLTEDTNHIFIIADDSAPTGNNINFYDGTDPITSLQMTNQTGTVDISNVPYSKPGYTFVGWSQNGTIVTSVDASQGDVDVYAVWAITATFMNGNATWATQTVNVGSNIVAPATNPTQTGAVFAGWYDASDSNQTIVTFPVVASTAVTYQAKFAQQYTITFIDRGDTVGTQTGLEGAAIQFPAEADLDPNPGYTLSGWTPADTTINSTTSTYTAVWSPKDYTITYNTNGGTGTVAPASVTYGTPIPAGPASGVSKTGYTLSGWTYSDGTNTYAEGDNMPAANLTATAVWTANTYTATFNISYNGTTTQFTTVDAAFDSEITMPALPTEAGYSFSAWSPANNIMDSEGKTFTTTKTANYYDVRFLPRTGNTPISQDSLAYGSTVTFPAAPAVTGMSFTGWQRSTDGGFIPDGTPETVPASNVDYRAVYEGNAHTVTYYVDGQVDHTATVNYGAVIPTPDYTPPTGYSWSGWVLPASATDGIMPDSDISVTSTTAINEYTITFKYGEVNGNAVYDTITANYGTAVTAPAAPTAEGHTFANWDTEIPATIPAEDITITALWTVNDYTITFKPENGENDIVYTLAYGSALTAPTVTREGYTFDSWDPTVPATVPASNATYTAQWDINSYTVTYQTRDLATGQWARFGQIETYQYGETIVDREKKTQTGWDYSDWSEDPDTAVALPATMPARNIVAYSTGTKHVYTDTWYDIDGTVLYTAQVEFGAAIPQKTLPVHEGYDNPYWSPRYDVQPAQDVDFTYSAASGSATYSVVYKYQNLTQTGYEDGETTTVNSNTGATVTATNSMKTRTGFTLNEGLSTLTTTVAGNGSSQLVLVFDRNTYTLTVKDGDTTTVNNYLYGATVTEPVAAGKEGYTFGGWTYTKDSNGASYSFTSPMPALSYTATAKYTIESYTLTPYVDYADGNGFTALAPISYQYGATIATVADPSQTGYVFDGWYAEQACQTDYVFGGAMPAQNVAIYGRLVAKEYTITFVNNVTGDTIDSITEAYGTAVTYPAAPTVEGYTFSGWSANYATIPAENVTVYAYYGTGSFTLTYDVDGVLTTKTYAYDAPITPIASPTKLGYEFAGWLPAVPANMPAENLTVVAQWTTLAFDATFIAVEGDETAYATVSDVLFGGNITAPAENPDRTNYDFVGWKVAGTSDADVVTFPYVMNAEGITFVGVWQQDTSAIRVQSVTRVTTPYYQKGEAEYAVAINEPAFKLHITDGTTIWTYSKGSFYNAPEASGVFSITTDAETGYEVWNINISLGAAENVYKAYCTTMDYYAETADQGLVFNVAYDERTPEVIANECSIDGVSGFITDTNKVVRGEAVTFTITTATNVTWLKLSYNYYSIKEDVTKSFNTLYKCTTTSDNVVITDNGDGTMTWAITAKLTFSTTDPRVEQNWTVYYKTGATSDYIPVNEEDPIKIVVCYNQAATVDTAEGYEKYSIVSAEPANGTVASGTRDIITIVTTDDCDKVRVCLNNKNTTFQTTTANNVSYSDNQGLRTWQINYKYAPAAGQYTVSCQARGSSWGDSVSYNIVIT